MPTVRYSPTRRMDGTSTICGELDRRFASVGPRSWTGYPGRSSRGDEGTRSAQGCGAARARLYEQLTLNSGPIIAYSVFLEGSRSPCRPSELLPGLFWRITKNVCESDYGDRSSKAEAAKSEVL